MQALSSHKTLLLKADLFRGIVECIHMSQFGLKELYPVIKALIFDFDGLILDTETHEYEVLQEIFEEHGSVFAAICLGKVIGTAAGFRPFDYLEEQIGKKLNHEELTQLRRERFAKRMETEKARPGVEAYLNAAKDLGLK